MIMVALYYVLLAIWLPLLWPAFRLAGRARIWLLIVAACGALATVHEIRIVFWTISAIRLDIFLIAILLLVLYAITAVVLVRANRRKASAMLALALLVIGGGMAWNWFLLGRKSEHVMATFKAANALLFEAKFRDRETYLRQFGPFEPADAHPVGHWTARDPIFYTRLIINGAGRAWLFYRCAGSDCAYRSRDAGLRPIAGEAGADGAATPSGKSWQTAVGRQTGPPFPVRITRTDAGGLGVEVQGETISFAAAPPPIAATPPVAKLKYLGAYASATCLRQIAKIRQLWLWREGTRLYGVGIFATLPAGQRADFVSPVVLGEGRPDGASWRFELRHRGDDWTATVTLDRADGLALALDRAGQATERLTLRQPAIFHDEVIDLASLTGKAAWNHWFATVLVGRFSSAEIPACPGQQGSSALLI